MTGSPVGFRMLSSAVGLLLLLPAAGAAQSDGGAVTDPMEAVGIWNLEMDNLAQRATGGVQNKILRIEQQDGSLTAEMTSPRNDFLPVDELQWADGRLHFFFGAYEYSLEMEEGALVGIQTSPIDTLRVRGSRQSSTLYTGDEYESWVTTRTGIIGVREALAPPDDAGDPGEWVRSRATSLEDLVLVIRGNPVSFVNPEDFEEKLWSNAGREVSIVGEWEGERLRIDSLEPS